MTFIVTGPYYSATIPAAMSVADARRVACEDSGLMPWQLTVRTVEGQNIFQQIERTKR